MALRSRRVIRYGTWLIIAAVLSALAFALERSDSASMPEVRIADLPRDARLTFQRIKRGGPYPYERDGVTFGNYEQRLPSQSRGYYREYTVPTPGLKHRGARRMVVGCERQPPALRVCRDGGEFYFTDDHYRSFQRVIE